MGVCCSVCVCVCVCVLCVCACVCVCVVVCMCACVCVVCVCVCVTVCCVCVHVCDDDTTGSYTVCIYVKHESVSLRLSYGSKLYAVTKHCPVC